MLKESSKRCRKNILNESKEIEERNTEREREILVNIMYFGICFIYEIQKLQWSVNIACQLKTEHLMLQTLFGYIYICIHKCNKVKKKKNC